MQYGREDQRLYQTFLQDGLNCHVPGPERQCDAAA